MKPLANRILLLFAVLVMLSSCKTWNSLFGPKYGCPANSKNVGAERALNGEKTPKEKKFRQSKF